MPNIKPYTRKEKLLDNIAKAVKGEEKSQISPFTREEQLLSNIADAAGSGSELPAYTAADDGKVLTVDGSGATPELVWGEGGGGSDLPEYSVSDIG